MRRGTMKAAFLAGAVAFSIPGGAQGQTADEDSVARRARPDFDPIGIELDEMLGVIGLVSKETIRQKSSPLSSFVVLPTFGITGTYESNIFLSNANAVADKRVTYNPGIAIQSDWSSHSFALAGSANVARYDENTKENFEDFQVQASGSLDIRDNKSLKLVAGYAQRHQERNAEDDPGQAFDPIVYTARFVDGTAEYNADAVLLRFRAQTETQDYRDAQGLDNSVKNLTIVNLTARAGYEFTPGTTIFVEPKADFRSFERKRDTAGLLQDNYAMGGLVGVTWDLTGVTFAEFGIGLSRRSYDEPTFKTATNLDFSGRLVWNVTDLLTLSSNLNRTTAESSTVGESGVLTTVFTNRLDYEFLDNIIVTAGAGLTDSDNQQTARRDRTYDFDAGVTYLVNENWSAKLSVKESRRSSSLATKDYDSLVAGLTLTAKL